MKTFTAIAPTWLKKDKGGEILQALSLGLGEKSLISNKQRVQIDRVLEQRGGHLKVKLAWGQGEWWIYQKHFIEEEKKKVVRIVSQKQLREMLPYALNAKIDIYLDPLNNAMGEFEINTPLRIAAFIAQLAHESGSLRYSQEIATGAAYEGRKDLGNIQRGDGVRYKGRGLFQLTGRHNFTLYGRLLGLDLVTNPTYASEPNNSARIAGLYWSRNNLNHLADRGEFRQITKRINGGYNGEADRNKHYALAKGVLGI